MRFTSAFASLVLASSLVVGCGGSSGGGGPSTDASLAALSTSGGALTPPFSSGVTAYTVNVSAFTASVTVTPTATDAGATIQVNGVPVASGTASGPIPLAPTPNPTPVNVSVTAADTTTMQTYTIVFARTATAFQDAYVKASNTGAGDQFGFNVSVSGDTLVVGAPFEGSAATGVGGNQADNTAADAGAAYVYVRAGGVWTFQAYLKASNTNAGDFFGTNIAILGDTVVVTANGEGSNATGVGGNEADNSAAGAGAAYVFVRTGTTWSQQAYLKASNTEAGDNFGFNVAIAGDTLVVGAPQEDSNATGVGGSQADNSASSSGAAYVFVRTGTTWSQQAYLKASNAGTGDFFGVGVAVATNTIVIGADSEDSNATGVGGNEADNSASGSGAAYVFVRTGTTWSQQAYVKATNTGAGDVFGRRVAVDGDTAVVGGQFEDSASTGVGGAQADETAANAGAAYVYLRTGSTWAPQAYLKASNTGAGDFFGRSVAVLGDTIVVGAPNEDSNATGVGGNQADNTAANSGAAYVFSRTGGVWTQIAYLKQSNTEAGDVLGVSVSITTDKIAVGAILEDSSATGVGGNQADNTAADSGAAYVYR